MRRFTLRAFVPYALGFIAFGLILGLGTSTLAKVVVDPHPTNPSRVLLTYTVKLPVTDPVPANRTDTPLDQDEQGVRDALALRLDLFYTCNQTAIDVGTCTAGQLGKVRKRKVLCTSELITSGDCLVGELGTLISDPRSVNRVINERLDRLFARLVREGRERYIADMQPVADVSDVETD